MVESSGLKFFRTIKTGKGLMKLVLNLRTHRRLNKVTAKRSSLTKNKRALILAKTDGRCHMCGVELTVDNFQADHVKTHSSGGAHAENNYLPSCSICNNYRCHYSSEEIQIILRLGVWAKSKILTDTPFALELANSFVKHEMSVRKRRKARNEK